MIKNNMYGEILYIGFVAEKGRVVTELRKHSYRKTLKLHVDLWHRIVTRMFDSTFTDEDEELIKYFAGLCKSNIEFGKYYMVKPNVFSEIEKEMNQCINIVKNSKEDMIIINIMNDLILELVELLKHEVFVNKKQIHSIIRTLHNLPRYFLQSTGNSAYEVKEMVLDFDNVIECSFSNMNQQMKYKYDKYRNNN